MRAERTGASRARQREVEIINANFVLLLLLLHAVCVMR